MTSLMNLSENELLTFFGVLVRVSVLFAVLPFFGDRTIPNMVKVLLSLTVTVAIFPTLIRTNVLRPDDAAVWGTTAFGLVGTIVKEAALGLTLGFVAKVFFEAISVGTEMIGNLMGLATASMYDPHSESQTQVLSRIHTTLAMLLFLALDGHHLLLQTVMDSFKVVNLGALQFTGFAAGQLIDISGEVLRKGIQIASPMILCTMLVYIFYGIFSRALPQVNILVLSLSISAATGLIVMLMSLSEFQDLATDLFARMQVELHEVMRGLS